MNIEKLGFKIVVDRPVMSEKSFEGSLEEVFEWLAGKDLLSLDEVTSLLNADDPIKAFNSGDLECGHIGDLGVEMAVSFDGDLDNDYVKVDDLEDLKDLLAMDVRDSEDALVILI